MVSNGHLARQGYYGCCAVMMALTALQHADVPGEEPWLVQLATAANCIGLVVSSCGFLASTLGHHPMALHFFWVYFCFPAAYLSNMRIMAHPIDHATVAAILTFASVFLELPLTVTTLGCAFVICPSFITAQWIQQSRSLHAASQQLQQEQCQLLPADNSSCPADASVSTTVTIGSILPRAVFLVVVCMSLNLVAQVLMHAHKLLDRQQERQRQRQQQAEKATRDQHPDGQPQPVEGSEVPLAPAPSGQLHGVVNTPRNAPISASAPATSRLWPNESWSMLSLMSCLSCRLPLQRGSSMTRESRGTSAGTSQAYPAAAATNQTPPAWEMLSQWWSDLCDRVMDSECRFYKWLLDRAVMKHLGLSIAICTCVPVVVYTFIRAFMGLLYTRDDTPQDYLFSPSWMLMSGICCVVLARLNGWTILQSLVQQQMHTSEMEGKLAHLQSTHAALLEERRALEAQLLQNYAPRTAIDAGTPADKLLNLLNKLITGEGPPPVDELLGLHSALLNGSDLYQPVDLAAKLVASAVDEDVGANLVSTLGPGFGRQRTNYPQTTSQMNRSQRSNNGGPPAATCSMPCMSPTRTTPIPQLPEVPRTDSCSNGRTNSNVGSWDGVTSALSGTRDDWNWPPGSRPQSFNTGLRPLDELGSDTSREKDGERGPEPSNSFGSNPGLRSILEHIVRGGGVPMPDPSGPGRKSQSFTRQGQTSDMGSSRGASRLGSSLGGAEPVGQHMPPVFQPHRELHRSVSELHSRRVPANPSRAIPRHVDSSHTSGTNIGELPASHASLVIHASVALEGAQGEGSMSSQQRGQQGGESPGGADSPGGLKSGGTQGASRSPESGRIWNGSARALGGHGMPGAGPHEREGRANGLGVSRTDFERAENRTSAGSGGRLAQVSRLSREALQDWVGGDGPVRRASFEHQVMRGVANEFPRASHEWQLHQRGSSPSPRGQHEGHRQPSPTSQAQDMSQGSFFPMAGGVSPVQAPNVMASGASTAPGTATRGTGGGLSSALAVDGLSSDSLVTAGSAGHRFGSPTRPAAPRTPPSHQPSPTTTTGSQQQQQQPAINGPFDGPIRLGSPASWTTLQRHFGSNVEVVESTEGSRDSRPSGSLTSRPGDALEQQFGSNVDVVVSSEGSRESKLSGSLNLPPAGDAVLLPSGSGLHPPSSAEAPAGTLSFGKNDLLEARQSAVLQRKRLSLDTGVPTSSLEDRHPEALPPAMALRHPSIVTATSSLTSTRSIPPVLPDTDRANSSLRLLAALQQGSKGGGVPEPFSAAAFAAAIASGGSGHSMKRPDKATNTAALLARGPVYGASLNVLAATAQMMSQGSLQSPSQAVSSISQPVPDQFLNARTRRSSSANVLSDGSHRNHHRYPASAHAFNAPQSSLQKASDSAPGPTKPQVDSEQFNADALATNGSDLSVDAQEMADFLPSIENTHAQSRTAPVIPVQFDPLAPIPPQQHRKLLADQAQAARGPDGGGDGDAPSPHARFGNRQREIIGPDDLGQPVQQPAQAKEGADEEGRALASPGLALLDEVEQLLAHVDDWEFDAFALLDATQGHPLSTLSFFLMTRSGLVKRFNMDGWCLARFLSHIEDGYLDNPYHNKTHAAHVLHRLHVMLHFAGFMDGYADQLTLLGCYLAAAIHDYEHLGITNDFLINTQDPLAILYNDRAPLENHHLAASWALIRQPGYNFLEHMPRSDFDRLRKMVIELVLGTDMKLHFSLLSQFNAVHQAAMTRRSTLNKSTTGGRAAAAAAAEGPNNNNTRKSNTPPIPIVLRQRPMSITSSDRGANSLGSGHPRKVITSDTGVPSPSSTAVPALGASPTASTTVPRQPTGRGVSRIGSITLSNLSVRTRRKSLEEDTVGTGPIADAPQRSAFSATTKSINAPLLLPPASASFTSPSPPNLQPQMTVTSAPPDSGRSSRQTPFTPASPQPPLSQRTSVSGSGVWTPHASRNGSRNASQQDLVALGAGEGAAPPQQQQQPPAGPLMPLDENERMLSLQIAIKAADICNLCDPHDSHLRWIQMLEEEFFRQGDVERDLGMTISPLFDRNKPGVSKSQVVFMDIVAVPLFTALTAVFPGAEPLLRGLMTNYNHWVAEGKRQEEAKEEAKEEEAAATRADEAAAAATKADEVAAAAAAAKADEEVPTTNNEA